MRYREGAGRRAFAEKGFRMKFIKDYSDGDRVFDIYLCKHKISAVTKNGKPYETVILQDKTGPMAERRCKAHPQMSGGRIQSCGLSSGQ